MSEPPEKSFILGKDSNLCSCKVLVCRHAKDDESFIDGEFNAHLTNNGVFQAKELAHKALELYNFRSIDRINITSSEKMRSIETAEILTDYFLSKNIPASCGFDERLSGFYQGVILQQEAMSYEDKKAKLKEANKQFLQNALVKKDYTYRFGQDMPDFINPVGENQNEFLYRTYRFLYDALTIYKKYGAEQVIVTHAANAERILDIANYMRTGVNNEKFDKLKMQHGGYRVADFGDIDVAVKSLSSKIAEIRKNICY